MLARLVFGAVLLGSAVVSSAVPQRVYVVAWASDTDATPEHRALIGQVDRQLRDELQRRGAMVAEGRPTSPAAIVLKPRLEVLPRALKLSLVGVRSADGGLLGTISTKAAGSSRAAQVRAIVTRACDETGQL